MQLLIMQVTKVESMQVLITQIMKVVIYAASHYAAYKGCNLCRFSLRRL